MKIHTNKQKVVIIGAGPVGLSAAAHLTARGLIPVVLEKGATAGYAMTEWGHVRVFTPWQYITDPAVVKLLEQSDWQHPPAEDLPTAREIVDQYLIPAATSPELKHSITYNASVTAISKKGLSKSSSQDRDNTPFIIHYETADHSRHIIEATAVIDASGTWHSPNPIGTDGLPVAGEIENSDAISYGIPDTLGKDRALYAGKRTLVLGGGHSAINVVVDILNLQGEHPDTKLFWGLRRNNLDRLLGGGINDELPARGALGIAAKKAIDGGGLKLLAPSNVEKITQTNDGLDVDINVSGTTQTIGIDRIIVATGFRPDTQMLREIRLSIDEIVEAPTKLAPMIDPNLHSCGTVKPHGVDELSHPDKNFFIVGMKSYGRAPTFLMLTGYEQVRSIADELVGEHEAARKIELNLPETGVCNSRLPDSAASLNGNADDSDTGCCAPTPMFKPIKDTGSGGCCTPSPAPKKNSEPSSGCCS